MKESTRKKLHLKRKQVFKPDLTVIDIDEPVEEGTYYAEAVVEEPKEDDDADK